MEFDEELLAKAKQAKDAKEISTLAKENGLDVDELEANRIYAFLHKHGDISDEELENVTGGNCMQNISAETPKFRVGQEVYGVYRPHKFVITGISKTREKVGLIWKDFVWFYTARYLTGSRKGQMVQNPDWIPEYALSEKQVIDINE